MNEDNMKGNCGGGRDLYLNSLKSNVLKYFIIVTSWLSKFTYKIKSMISCQRDAHFLIFVKKTNSFFLFCKEDAHVLIFVYSYLSFLKKTLILFYNFYFIFIFIFNLFNLIELKYKRMDKRIKSTHS